MVEVGQKAPDLTLPDQDWNRRSLAEFLQKGKVILAFFVGAFSSVCTKEMCTFRDSFSRLQDAGAQLVGISLDLPFSLKAWVDTHGLKFPHLSDFNKEAIRAYGVVLPELRGLKDFTRRSIFVIDRNGIVRYKWVAEVNTMEPLYEEVIAAVKAAS